MRDTTLRYHTLRCHTLHGTTLPYTTLPYITLPCTTLPYVTLPRQYHGEFRHSIHTRARFARCVRKRDGRARASRFGLGEILFFRIQNFPKYKLLSAFSPPPPVASVLVPRKLQHPGRPVLPLNSLGQRYRPPCGFCGVDVSTTDLYLLDLELREKAKSPNGIWPWKPRVPPLGMILATGVGPPTYNTYT